MTADCLIVGDEVEMPSGSIEETDVVRAIEADESARNLSIEELALVSLHYLYEWLVRLVLRKFAAHENLVEHAVNLNCLEVVWIF